MVKADFFPRISLTGSAGAAGMREQLVQRHIVTGLTFGAVKR